MRKNSRRRKESNTDEQEYGKRSSAGKKRRTSTKVQNKTWRLNFLPKNNKQDELFTSFDINALVIASGSAGCGKTFVTVAKAIQMLKNREIRQIILTRPTVSMSKTGVGFLPGTNEEKLAPWLAPALSNFYKQLPRSDVDTYLRKGIIQLTDLSSVRGMSYDDGVFIIVDESQNLTLDQIKSLVTRVGENSIIAFLGDPEQTDLPRHSGFQTFIDMLESYEYEDSGYERTGHSITEFTVDDIVRSGLCKRMILMFNEYKSAIN